MVLVLICREKIIPVDLPAVLEVFGDALFHGAVTGEPLVELVDGEPEDFQLVGVIEVVIQGEEFFDDNEEVVFEISKHVDADE